ncbi:collagen alpha-2(IV) chain-like isoform X1 [Carassius auratus]|uniref:Collagen alpha-2(IV) chain-like isoform X1 n=2 Tax=Carassius auratus TaxID=7957 RepID=A0A6P6M9E8_CARAU|nr:collagen alpha-2(IV) chain-like isoform X1 [Carassius auratus]
MQGSRKMVTLRLMWGLLVLCVVAASPRRYVRQAELDKFYNNNVDLDLNVDTDDVYDYYDGIDEPQIEIGTLRPDEDVDPSHHASLEEEEEEEVEHVEPEERRTAEGSEDNELPIKPQHIPSGSGESGTLMGPSAQGEEELRLTPIDILQISGDISGSGDSGSGDLLDEKASGSGEPLGSGGSGDSGDISSSVDSEDLGSGVSGLFGSGIILISGGEEELHLMVENIPHEASGDFGESGISLVSGASGFPELSGEPSASGVLGDPVASVVLEGSGESGASGVPELSGESGLSEVPEVSGYSGTSGLLEKSGEPEASGMPAASGGPEASGEPEISGSPEISGLPEVSGEPEASGSPEISGSPEASGSPEISGSPEASGSPEISGSPEASGSPEISGEPEASGSPEISGSPEVSGEPEASGEPEISGSPEASGKTEISGLPDASGEPEISVVLGVPEKPGPFDVEFVLKKPRVPEESKQPEVTLESGESGSPEESGVTEAPVITNEILIPDLDKEEEILLTTPTTPLEGTGVPDIDIDTTGMGTCLLCTCLVGSVYCDDLKLDHVPPLSKETTHFYARYNKIARIGKSSFANLNKLKRIDLTSNGISWIDDDAFFGLPALEELVLRENSIRQLPALPHSMILIDASLNHLGSTGIQREAFKDMPGLLYLYLTDNNINHIPVPLPDSLRSLHLQNNNIQMMHEDTFCNPHDLNYIRNALEDVRLDGNPINLSRTPQAYICLPRIPIGALI